VVKVKGNLWLKPTIETELKCVDGCRLVTLRLKKDSDISIDIYVVDMLLHKSNDCDDDIFRTHFQNDAVSLKKTSECFLFFY